MSRAIIFGNRRDETRKLEARLKSKGIKAALLSGEVPQHKRIKTLEQFKSGQVEILVATDVAAAVWRNWRRVKRIFCDMSVLSEGKRGRGENGRPEHKQDAHRPDMLQQPPSRRHN